MTILTLMVIKRVELSKMKYRKAWICKKCGVPCELMFDSRHAPVACPAGAGTGMSMIPRWERKTKRKDEEKESER